MRIGIGYIHPFVSVKSGICASQPAVYSGRDADVARAVMHQTPMIIVGREVHFLHPPKNPCNRRPRTFI